MLSYKTARPLTIASLTGGHRGVLRADARVPGAELPVAPCPRPCPCALCPRARPRCPRRPRPRRPAPHRRAAHGPGRQAPAAVRDSQVISIFQR